MKKELEELQLINDTIQNKLLEIKNNTAAILKDNSSVRAIKNDIYQKASKTFIYNLKKLIQVEGTQKNFAKKIGISEDLLSKYKSGDAFPPIETLIYICHVYNLNLDNLVNKPLTPFEIENLDNGQDCDLSIFENTYYTYFFVTNLRREGTIHEGLINISKCNINFKILSEGTAIKEYTGNYLISDKLIFFDFHSHTDGNAYITMIQPALNKSKYVGGLAMLLLPSDANSKPCAQKIILSKLRINRELYYADLKKLLNFKNDSSILGNVKVSHSEDEEAYEFIESLM